MLAARHWDLRVLEQLGSQRQCCRSSAALVMLRGARLSHVCGLLSVQARPMSRLHVKPARCRMR